MLSKYATTPCPIMKYGGSKMTAVTGNTNRIMIVFPSYLKAQAHNKHYRHAFAVDCYISTKDWNFYTVCHSHIRQGHVV